MFGEDSINGNYESIIFTHRHAPYQINPSNLHKLSGSIDVDYNLSYFFNSDDSMKFSKTFLHADEKTKETYHFSGRRLQLK